MKALRTLKPFIWNHRLGFAFGILCVFITNAIAPLVPILIGQAVNFAENGTISGDELMSFSILILLIAAIAGAFRFLMRRILIDCSREIEYEFRNAFFHRLQKLDPSFYDANNTGDLMSRATNDTDALRMLIGPAVMYSCNTIFSLPIVLASMFWLNWKLTLLVMIPMLALPPLVRYFGHHMHKRSRAQQDAFGDLTTMVQENLSGIRVVKAYQQEPAQRKKFLDHNNDYVDKSLSMAKLQSAFFPTIRLLVGSGFIILLTVGGWQIIQGSLQVGTLVSFILLFERTVWPLIAAGWVLNIIQRGVASMERINHVMDATSEVVDPPATERDFSKLPVDIRFKDLTFQYGGTEVASLYDVDLDVPQGRVVGVVGPVGSGKSTLIHLLARFYPVERGMVEIGGVDINDWPLDELRRRVSFVFQETFLFSDTIGWNIRFGTSDDAPQESVVRAAQAAQVAEDIEDFPKGYDTVLGERGVNLSGGQKQRTAIARALLRSGDILVLDDSLSAVDTHTEEAVLKELETVMKGRTTFLISHRISTVSMADEIIVLQDGRISQRGNHDALIASPGLYAELYRKQLLEEEAEAFDGKLTEQEEVTS